MIGYLSAPEVSKAAKAAVNWGLQQVSSTSPSHTLPNSSRRNTFPSTPLLPRAPFARSRLHESPFSASYLSIPKSPFRDHIQLRWIAALLLAATVPNRTLSRPTEFPTTDGLEIATFSFDFRFFPGRASPQILRYDRRSCFAEKRPPSDPSRIGKRETTAFGKETGSVCWLDGQGLSFYLRVSTKKAAFTPALQRFIVFPFTTQFLAAWPINPSPQVSSTSPHHRHPSLHHPQLRSSSTAPVLCASLRSTQVGNLISITTRPILSRSLA